MSLPTVRHRPPTAEIDVLADAVRALLQALDRRHVDLTRLDRAPEVVRVVSAMHCAELAAESWRRFGRLRGPWRPKTPRSAPRWIGPRRSWERSRSAEPTNENAQGRACASSQSGAYVGWEVILVSRLP